MSNNESSSSSVDVKTAVEQILGALREGIEGPPPNWGYFSDPGPEAGFLPLIAAMRAAEASRPTGGTTIAGHVHHLVFSLAAASAYIRGDKTPRNWDESWSLTTVDDAEWRVLRERLREEYETVLATIESHAIDGVAPLGISVGTAAHVAYHLGAVRQKIACGKVP
jgi:hypothetical protein